MGKLFELPSLLFLVTIGLYVACSSSEFGADTGTANFEADPEIKVGVIAGEHKDQLNGYYDNPKWGEMYMIIDKKNGMKATYNYDRGTVTGTYNPETGKITCYWCEVEGEVRDGPFDGGDCEFSFNRNENLKVELKGSWNHRGDPNKWYHDWDLTLDKNNNHEELESRFSVEKDFCYKK